MIDIARVQSCLWNPLKPSQAACKGLACLYEEMLVERSTRNSLEFHRHQLQCFSRNVSDKTFPRESIK